MKTKQKIILSVYLLVIVTNLCIGKEVPSKKIKKIILVCMENHSYDNLVRKRINVSYLNYFY